MKYIVYMTVNTVNNKIYVGVHKTQNPKVFDGYLGCGCNIKDKHSYIFCKYPIGKAITKYGCDKFKRFIIAEFNSQEEALKLEKTIVSEDFIKRSDTYNIALGGGVPPVSVKIIYQYTIEGEFIKEWPSITEASIFYNLSSSSIGKAIFDNTACKGYLWSDFKVDKLDLNNFNFDNRNIKCYLYDINGKYLNEFDSLKLCADFLNIKNSDLATFIKGKYSIKKQYYVSLYKYEELPINLDNVRTKKVYQYNEYGEFIKEWDNPHEAYIALKIKSGIPKACKLNQLCGGFLWSFEKHKCIKPYKKRARKVGQYDLEGNLIKEYNSVRKAKSEFSGVIHALSGLQKTSGGFIWKYID